MTSFGFMIIQTLVTDIEPDMKVRAAMNEINAAQRLRCPSISLSYWASVLGALVALSFGWALMLQVDAQIDLW